MSSRTFAFAAVMLPAVLFGAGLHFTPPAAHDGKRPADEPPAISPAPAASTPDATAAAKPARRNAYRQTILAANSKKFNPQIVDPFLLDCWGITIRPPGAGGHFWITNAASGTTSTFVGDVPGVPLHQDDLKLVIIPSSRLYGPHPDHIARPTGQVYTGHSETDFMVAGENLIGPSKFVFVTLDGSVSGWTTDMTRSVVMYDNSAAGSMYTGCAVTLQPSGNRLYICDFGLERVEVLDHEFKPVSVSGNWRDPQTPLDYSVYNLHYTEGRLFAAIARLGDDTGEEDIYPGYGYVAEFDLEGNLVASYEHRREINAPWGMAIAPDDFGALSRALLVANFGDGTIIAFDRSTRRFIDYLRDEEGKPVSISGLWGILFGNGVSLGRTNHLYFAAGPHDENEGIFGNQDGLFGKLEPVDPGSPTPPPPTPAATPTAAVSGTGPSEQSPPPQSPPKSTPGS